MTKEKMLNLIEKLISDKEADIKKHNKAILECKDSPRLTRELGFMHEASVSQMSTLQNLKRLIEEYDAEKVKAQKLVSFDMSCTPWEDLGITFTEEGE